MATRTSDYKIHLVNERKRLPARREPYWRHIAPRKFVGFRKTENGSETWIARYTDENNDYHTQSIGTVAELKWEKAQESAEEWFRQCDDGIVRAGTVDDVCRNYVANRRTEIGDHNADDAEKRFKAHVYGTAFGRTKADKLNAMHIERWRDTLLANTTFEMCRRTHKTLNAALNYGFRRGAIPSDGAWKRVPLVSGDAAENALDFYWSVAERRAFFEKCPDDLRDFLTAMSLTAARPQEMAGAKVKDFNLFARNLVLRHRKGKGSKWRERAFSLSNDNALAFFKRVSADKLPETPLLTRADGSSWYSDNDNGLWVSALKKVRRDNEFDDRVTAYHFRHWTITDWLNAGIVTANVATMTGTSIAMIDGFYKKFVKGRVDAQLAAMETV